MSRCPWGSLCKSVEVVKLAFVNTWSQCAPSTQTDSVQLTDLKPRLNYGNSWVIWTESNHIVLGSPHIVHKVLLRHPELFRQIYSNMNFNRPSIAPTYKVRVAVKGLKDMLREKNLFLDELYLECYSISKFSVPICLIKKKWWSQPKQL